MAFSRAMIAKSLCKMYSKRGSSISQSAKVMMHVVRSAPVPLCKILHRAEFFMSHFFASSSISSNVFASTFAQNLSEPVLVRMKNSDLYIISLDGLKEEL